jgi:predicted metal-binding membrane protein
LEADVNDKSINTIKLARLLPTSSDVPGALGRPTFGSKMAAAFTVIAALGLAGACWLISVHEMAGMNRGVATQFGAFSSYFGVWVAMMVAMMLPGSIPALLRRRRASPRALTVTFFTATYVAVWSVIGVAVFALYRPHGTIAAGVVTIAAGFYELTPAKRYFRERCAKCTSTGVVFGLDCVGSSIGLMATLIVLGLMDVGWMAIIAVVMIAQKLLPARTVVDCSLALAIIGLGIAILTAPSSIPGLLPHTILMPMK